MTAEEIAAQLPQLADGPHDDGTITAVARIAAEAIRVLNHATMPGRGLSEPATVCAVLGELAAAAHRLPQLCGQLAGWLRQQDTAGQLAHPAEGLPSAVHDALAGLDRAARDATCLGEALDQAQQATAWLYRPGEGGEDR
jgi:hypothetical protein